MYQSILKQHPFSHKAIITTITLVVSDIFCMNLKRIESIVGKWRHIQIISRLRYFCDIDRRFCQFALVTQSDVFACKCFGLDVFVEAYRQLFYYLFSNLVIIRQGLDTIYLQAYIGRRLKLYIVYKIFWSVSIQDDMKSIVSEWIVIVWHYILCLPNTIFVDFYPAQ